MRGVSNRRMSPALSFATLSTRLLFALLLIPGLSQAAPSAGTAEPATSADEAWQLHGQATYVWQHKAAMSAPYSGDNSLGGPRALSYSFTATAAAGWRPWAGGELYGNLEGAQGVPLSNLTGLGGFTNGEMARSSGAQLKLYRARLYGRQTWDLGDEREAVDSDFNQLAGLVAKRRLALTVGNLSVADVFDRNAYSHDPRTQFLNWSLMALGAYDYAADARGYTQGFAVEWYHDDWALRAGRFALPEQPNQQRLDDRLLRHFGDQIELEHHHRIAEQAGAVRVLLFRDRARLARFDDALAQQSATGVLPTLDQARHQVHSKRGVGLGLEQALGERVGLFARWSAADGATETDAFTEIDRSLSAGLLVDGALWQRAGDSLGLGGACNRLSAGRRDYLAAGGNTFFLGDGGLRYQPEQVVEAFYNLQLHRLLTVSLNAQRIANPGYNADRGPVTVLSTRLHLAF